ncbi:MULTISPECIES: phage head completion protein [Enterobacter cloacae complex]|uniref:phage head completion protein n=1 Tax=Enterobacter cloacae complex TaxID=354276 RepID=UPI001238D8FE|nr:head-tail adaptor protein [Enterobacter hormaechei]EKS7210431.1 head-tail adaptor protein [Enterobacter ludwigii]QEU15155.1 head-tail adaptor protein [Enterobacter hormaechei]
MSDPLRPGELNCRITLSYVETERGELGETLPAREVIAGNAWSKKELVSGRKVRTLDQQQVVETCLFTLYPREVDVDWKVSTADRVYTVRNVERLTDRIIITGEADSRHDRVSN